MDIKGVLTSRRNISVDLKRITPQSMYYGTSDYYKEKLGDRLPEYEYEILEAKQKQYEKDYIELIKQQAIDEFNRLMNEYEERANEGKDDLQLENLNIDENYFIAK